MDNLKETDLYLPIKEYLLDQGYKVNGEVLNCDVTAIKDDELIVIELKKTLNLSLITQAVNRQKYADSVYVAVAEPKDNKYSKTWKAALHLLKRLEIGLITISFLKSGKRINIIFHPEEYKPKRSHKKRFNILKEIDNRTYDKNTGGSSKTKLLTAYRENCIFIACCLKKYGPLSPAKLKKLGTGDKTLSILYKNFYNWFDKVDRGIYKLNSLGKKELKKYPDIIKYYKKYLSDKKTAQK
jgi:hypothetical protein